MFIMNLWITTLIEEGLRLDAIFPDLTNMRIRR